MPTESDNVTAAAAQIVKMLGLNDDGLAQREIDLIVPILTDLVAGETEKQRHLIGGLRAANEVSVKERDTLRAQLKDEQLKHGLTKRHMNKAMTTNSKHYDALVKARAQLKTAAEDAALLTTGCPQGHVYLAAQRECPTCGETAELRALLEEWKQTPFFKDRSYWDRWVYDFGGRVNAALQAHGGE